MPLSITPSLTVVILDRNADIYGIIDMLMKEMKGKGMDVHYRDWVGIIQGYSPVYKSQVTTLSVTSVVGISLSLLIRIS